MNSVIRPGVTVLSCVGGGPMDRIAEALRDRGWSAHVDSGFSPAAWRAAMTVSTPTRLSARARAFVGYPGSAVARLARRGGIAVATTNPFLLPWWLCETAPLHARPVVALMYDLFPDALEASGRAASMGPLTRMLEVVNRRVFAAADAVVFIGRRMADHARARYGEPRRWTVIETGASIREFDLGCGADEDESELEEWCRGRFVASYVGNLGLMHDWGALAVGVPRFLSACAERGIRAGFVLAASGPGVAALTGRWPGGLGEQIRVVGPLEDRPWARLLRRSTVSVVTLRASAARTSIPSKAFSAMAAGNAIVAVCPGDSDIADLVERHQAGVLVPPGDGEALSAALVRLAADADRCTALRRAARTAAERYYDTAILAARWETLLQEVWAERGRWVRTSVAAKRALDVAGAAVGLLAAAPVLAASGLAILLESGFPVLFRQTRPGLDGRPFELIKFRTMRPARPGEALAEADGRRLTRVGRVLRSTSIDELPTLWNVLRGEMSLVGPRPLLMQYLQRYDSYQARRHEVSPGITGWAQVNGRNAISWDEKFQYDVWYVDNRSLLLDLIIIARTVKKVLRREGINRPGHATMPEFMGTAMQSSG